MKENAAGSSVPVARYLLLGLDFFLMDKKGKKMKFTTGEDHLLGQDAAECMSVLLH